MNTSLLSDINWEKVENLVPVIIQDIHTSQVLMLGYMTAEALQKTIDDEIVCFWSRTKKRLWTKGETSGHTLEVKNIVLDCDADTLLISVIPNGPTCHTGTVSCFNSKNQPDILTLGHLFKVLQQRKNNLPERSYSTRLFQNTNLIYKKLREECEEVIEAVEENHSKQHIIEESCDVLFHLSVLMVQKNIGLQELETEFAKRNLPNYSHKNDDIHRTYTRNT